MTWFRPGEIIDGRYELGPLLGEGGFGVVYKAKQISTGQSVAVKFILQERLGSAKNAWIELARFEREMKMISQLRHPNVVRLIDTGNAGGKHLYMVLEYVNGRTLWAILRDGPLDPVEAGHVMFQVLDALGAAHGVGIIHRDLKPQNIMLTEGGFRRNAMVLDFGVAGVLKHARDMHYVSLTNDSEIRGTPSYMAPEQLRQGPLSPQIDIYAWGLVFIEILTGQQAIQGENAFEVALRQADDDPVDIPASIADPSLRAILAKAVEKNPNDRYASAAEALLDLQTWLSTALANPKNATLEWAETAEHSNAAVSGILPPVSDKDPTAGTPKAPKADRAGKQPATASRRHWPAALLGVLLLVGLAVVLIVVLGKEDTADEAVADECSAHSDCAGDSVCSPANSCVEWQTEYCSLAEGPIGEDNTLIVGAIAPTDRNSYVPREQAIRLAVKEVNDAGGLPGGQKLALISCNDSGMRAQGLEAARHLVSNMGAVGIIGPAYSSIFVDVVSEVTREAGVYVISHAATGAALTELADDGLAWRTVPSDKTQAEAMARLVLERGDQNVTILAKGDTYGSGLLDGISRGLIESFGRALNAVTYPEVNPNLSAVVSDAARPNTQLVVVLGTSEATEIVRLYEAEVRSRNYPLPRYLLSESGKRQEILDLAAATPGLLGRIDVVAPSDRNGATFDAFDMRLRARFGHPPEVGKVANAYDAVYVLAYAASAVPDGVPITGRAIAAQMPRLNSGQPVDVGPADLGGTMRMLAAGEEIDLSGASGSLDFDLATGDITGNALLWSVQRGVLGPVFHSAGQYTEAGWQIPSASLWKEGPQQDMVLLDISTMLLDVGWSGETAEALARAYPDAEGLKIGGALLALRQERIAGFSLGLTEVTWEHWGAHQRLVTGLGEVCESSLPSPGPDGVPVTQLGAAEAQAFCKSLGLRLPTAMELEAATRGIEHNDFGFSGDIDPARADALRAQTEAMTVPWNRTTKGVYDLSGSVAEWATCDVDARTHCAGGFGVVGGAGSDAQVWLRAGVMRPAPAEDLQCYRAPTIGFRCAADLPGGSAP